MVCICMLMAYLLLWLQSKHRSLDLHQGGSCPAGEVEGDKRIEFESFHPSSPPPPPPPPPPPTPPPPHHHHHRYCLIITIIIIIINNNIIIFITIIIIIIVIRAGVKYVLSNTNTNTFFWVSNTNTNTPAEIWSNTNTNKAHQIQIKIHTEDKTKLSFYRWHIKIHCILRKLFYLFKFLWELFPKVQSIISLHIVSDNGLELSRQQAIIWPLMARFTDA